MVAAAWRFFYQKSYFNGLAIAAIRSWPNVVFNCGACPRVAEGSRIS